MPLIKKMNMDINSSNHIKAVNNIFFLAKKELNEFSVVKDLFESSGISIDERLAFIAFLGPPELCLKALMDKLLYLPVPTLRISAQQILRKSGIPDL